MIYVARGRAFVPNAVRRFWGLVGVLPYRGDWGPVYVHYAVARSRPPVWGDRVDQLGTGRLMTFSDRGYLCGLRRENILIHKSCVREVGTQYISFPYQGKVDREARRKGSPPSLSFFAALTQITVKTPPSRQTEPPPLGWGGVLRRSSMTTI